MRIRLNFNGLSHKNLTNFKLNNFYIWNFRFFAVDNFCLSLFALIENVYFNLYQYIQNRN